MKINKKIVSIIVSIAFIALAVPLIITLFNVHEEVKSDIGKNAYINEFISIYALLGIEIVLSVIAVALLYSGQNSSSDIEIDESILLKNQKDEYEDNREEQHSYDKSLEQVITQVMSKVEKAKTLELKVETIFSTLAAEIEICQGVFYKHDSTDGTYRFLGGYALHKSIDKASHIKIGEGMVGQAVKNKKPIVINSVPDGYMAVVSGLGEANPNHLAIFPIISSNKSIAVIELASFKEFSSREVELLKKLTRLLASSLKEKAATKESTKKGNPTKK